MKTVLLILAVVLLILAGCGLQTVSLGSVTLHTGWFGMAFFVLACWASGPLWPSRSAT